MSKDLHHIGGIDLQPESITSDLVKEYFQHDLTARKPTLELIKKFEPQVIIHCAAMTNVDLCETEREKCWSSNVFATEHVAAGARKTGARIIYISTDYVFDGDRGPYREDDTPNPLGYYAKSKLAGENAVISSGAEWSVIRTIVLYGCGLGIKSSFTSWLLKELRSGKPVRIVNDQWGNSTLADDLAQAIDRLIFLEKQGLYHMGGRGFMTRFEMAQRTARFFGLDENLISPITTAELKQPARRPLRSGLTSEKAESDLYYNFCDLEQSLRIYLDIESSLN
jgi:dTDP-4-dehydrorhamnose reductase